MSATRCSYPNADAALTAKIHFKYGVPSVFENVKK